MKLFFITCGICLQSMLYACGGISQQVYAGKIEYSLNPANPLSCTVTITLDFDVNEVMKNDSIWVYWGDGAVTAVHAVSITEDSVASANMGSLQIYTHVYTDTHIYQSVPATGYYYISFANEFRLSGVSNINYGDNPGLPLYLAAQVSIDTAAGNQYQPLAFPPITVGFSDFVSYAENGLQQTGEVSDSVVYSFVTPREDTSSVVPQYQLPDQVCIANGSSNSSFTINPTNGNILWANPCLEGIYCFATLLQKYRNGQLISSVMREQNVYVTPVYVNGIKAIDAATGLQVFPNPAQQTLSGTVTVTAATSESMLEIVAPDGRVLAKNIPVNNGRFQTDISTLSAGIYFLHLQGASGAVSEKFIKQ